MVAKWIEPQSVTIALRLVLFWRISHELAMAQTGLLTPGTIGLVTRPCTDTQTQQNWQNVANNLVNLQTQIGDPSTLPPIISQIPGLDGVPGGPGGPGTSGTDGPAGTSGIDLTSLLRQILQTIRTIIETIGGLTPGSGVSAYASLFLTSTFNAASVDFAEHIFPFDTAGPSLLATPTTGAAAKITVASAGDYAVWFETLADETNATAISVESSTSCYLKKNGTAITGSSARSGGGNQVSTTAADKIGSYNNTSTSMILTLANGDYIQVAYRAIVADSYTTIANAVDPVVTSPLGSAGNVEFTSGRLNVIKLT